jgi:hypothetical protein
VATQTLLLLPVFLITGTPPQGLVTDLVVIAAWGLNLAVAEWLLRRPSFSNMPKSGPKLTRT